MPNTAIVIILLLSPNLIFDIPCTLARFLKLGFPTRVLLVRLSVQVNAHLAHALPWKKMQVTGRASYPGTTPVPLEFLPLSLRAFPCLFF